MPQSTKGNYRKAAPFNESILHKRTFNMTVIRVFALFLALSAPLTLAACGEDDDRETENGQQDDEDDNEEDD